VRERIQEAEDPGLQKGVRAWYLMRVCPLLHGQGLSGQGVDREAVKSSHPEDEIVIQGSLLILIIQRRKTEVSGGQWRSDLDLVKEGTVLQNAIIQQLIERDQVQFEIGSLLHLFIWLNY
jgi:hypothetical protein